MEPSKMPTRKVGASALAGALSVLMMWLLALAGVSIPAEVASAITTILSFVVAYFVRDKQDE